MTGSPPHAGSIGFIGVGTLARAMVAGLRTRWPARPIRLSPRSEAASAALAASDAQIERCASNDEVVRTSDIVVLTVRPPQFEAAVRDLPFRPGQRVLSCMTGVSLAELGARCGPAEVGRLLPVPSISRREGPLLLCPGTPEIRELVDGLGEVLAVPDEKELAALWPISTFMSSYFQLQGRLVRSVTERGADPETARGYVTSLLAALAKTGAGARSEDLSSLVTDHETPGGLNFRIRRFLEDAGWFDEVASAFDHTARLRSGDLG